MSKYLCTIQYITHTDGLRATIRRTPTTTATTAPPAAPAATTAATTAAATPAAEDHTPAGTVGTDKAEHPEDTATSGMLLRESYSSYSKINMMYLILIMIYEEEESTLMRECERLTGLRPGGMDVSK